MLSDAKLLFKNEHVVCHDGKEYLYDPELQDFVDVTPGRWQKFKNLFTGKITKRFVSRGEVLVTPDGFLFKIDKKPVIYLSRNQYFP